MKYTNKSLDSIKTYEVTINPEALKSIMVELDKDCYVRRYGLRKTEAHFQYEAREKIEGMVNNAGLKINESFRIKG